MKQEVKYQILFNGNEVHTANIIIDSKGLRVDKESKSEHISDDKFIRDFISTCLDLDDWKHSWYIEIDKAPYDKSIRKYMRGIFNDKIKQREQEIEELKNAKYILTKWR